MLYKSYPDSGGYSAQAVEHETRLKQSSLDGWIYIGTHWGPHDEPRMTNVGFTTQKLGTVATSSHNPFYVLLCAFKVKDGVSEAEGHAIESAVMRMLEREYSRIPYSMTQKMSDWFYAAPQEVTWKVNNFLGGYCNHYMLSYHCIEREIHVIFGWENENFLKTIPNRPYIAPVTSDPHKVLEF